MSLDLINAWAGSRGLSGRITVPGTALSFAMGEVRVTLRELSRNNILIRARVIDIPRDATAQDNRVRKAMEVALGRVRESACVLAVDAECGALWLQRRADAAASIHELGTMIDELVSEVDLWREIL